MALKVDDQWNLKKSSAASGKGFYEQCKDRVLCGVSFETVHPDNPVFRVSAVPMLPSTSLPAASRPAPLACASGSTSVPWLLSWLVHSLWLVRRLV